MKKPQTLQDFANSHIDDYTIIKETIDLYNENRKYFFQDSCAICDKILSVNERVTVEPNHFHFTCIVHRKFAHDFILDNIRLRLGYSKTSSLSIK
jgi:hypothetical protein